MDISENVKNIHKLTSLVVEKLGPGSGINFGLNVESVRWLEGYIERIGRPGLDETTIQGLVKQLVDGIEAGDSITGFFDLVLAFHAAGKL